nr:ribosome maturation factor RimP [Propionibacterium sp.]
MRTQDVRAVVTPVVEALGLEVDRLEVAAAGRRSVLRIYLDGDGPAGRGPTLDDIAEATRAVSRALDESDVTGAAPYLLEVSSRGVSRPLTEPKHFRRNTGRLVALTLADGGRTEGRVLGADADGVRLGVGGAERTVPYPAIEKAIVQVELNRLPDEGDTDALVGVDDEEE